jgi:hypothetical protein
VFDNEGQHWQSAHCISASHIKVFLPYGDPAGAGDWQPEHGPFLRQPTDSQFLKLILAAFHTFTDIAGAGMSGL